MYKIQLSPTRSRSPRSPSPRSRSPSPRSRSPSPRSRSPPSSPVRRLYEETYAANIPWPIYQKGESKTHYWNRVDNWLHENMIVECSYCLQKGHSLRECIVRKEHVCEACGMPGHGPSKCHKIKLGPYGEIGYCTYKKCKGREKWGHWLVTCPKRETEQGPFIFPEGTVMRRVYSDPKFYRY